MSSLRLIARMDIKGPNLIKGVQLEGLRVIGDPGTYAHKYYEDGCDELIYMDTVASLYGRNNLLDIVKHAARDCFVPITVGGGIRSVEDANALLRSGADKVAINTAATETPSLITDLSREFGSQAVVLSIEAKRIANNGPSGWEALTHNGREHTHKDVVEWARQGESLGAGEILLTSVDREGTRKGFDIELIEAVSTVVNIPVIASGGMGKSEDLTALAQACNVEAIAMADILHYQRSSLTEIRAAARVDGLPVRIVHGG